MSFKDNLTKFFNNVNENTTGWQDWLSGNTEGYGNFVDGVNSFNATIDEGINEITRITNIGNSHMSTATDWLTTYLDFVKFDTEIIDNYNKAKEVAKSMEGGEGSSADGKSTTENKEQSNPTMTAAAKTISEAIVNGVESAVSQIPTTKSYKTVFDKFSPQVFNNNGQKENLRSFVAREQDFIGNIYNVFLYIDGQKDGIKKGLSVRTKNLTIPTRQAETFKIDFMNRSIPKVDTSLNLNNIIDLTFTLDDELVIFKELTNHSGVTYMPMSSTKENFYDVVSVLQESGENKSELTSGFVLENSNLVLEIHVLSSTHEKNFNSIAKKLNESQNANVKKLLQGYSHSKKFKYKNLKIKSLGEINFDKNQSGPTTISLSAIFNPKTI